MQLLNFYLIRILPTLCCCIFATDALACGASSLTQSNAGKQGQKTPQTAIYLNSVVGAGEKPSDTEEVRELRERVLNKRRSLATKNN